MCLYFQEPPNPHDPLPPPPIVGSLKLVSLSRQEAVASFVTLIRSAEEIARLAPLPAVREPVDLIDIVHVLSGHIRVWAPHLLQGVDVDGDLTLPCNCEEALIC